MADNRPAEAVELIARAITAKGSSVTYSVPVTIPLKFRKAIQRRVNDLQVDLLPSDEAFYAAIDYLTDQKD